MKCPKCSKNLEDLPNDKTFNWICKSCKILVTKDSYFPYKNKTCPDCKKKQK